MLDGWEDLVMGRSLVGYVFIFGAAVAAFPVKAQVAPAAPASQAPPAGSYVQQPTRLREGASLAFRFANSRPMTANEQYRKVIDFARCAVSVSPSLSMRLLAADPASGRAIAVSRQLRGISRGCLPAGTFVPTTFFRSALAETLYAQADPLATIGPRPRLASSVAECVFVQSPQNVDALFQTSPGSKAESQVFDRLVPLGRNCTVNGDRVDITGKETALRSQLAEVAYRSSVR